MTEKSKTNPVKSAAKNIRDGQLKGTPRAVLEDLFDDFYKHRVEIYKMNFVRGIFLGFGTVIGGTIMVALLLWILSFFDQLPFIGDLVEAASHSIESKKR